jgi:6-phosphogluconate dehydrogenase
MVPSGESTEDALASLAGLLSPVDTIIEGGNSNYKETIRRGEDLAKHGVTMVDVGTSGGTWGLTEGYSLMVGGERDVVQRLKPLFHALAPAPDKGYGHVGPLGSGHFTKMVHNGIEYGLMQAYAEGFELMQAKSEFKLDLHQIAELWRHGSVVRSWLLDLMAAALAEEPGLESLEAYVDDSGEGRWTVDEAVALAVPLPVITAALQVRFRSRQEQPYSAKVLAAMRNQFGGHAVRKSE